MSGGPPARAPRLRVMSDHNSRSSGWVTLAVQFRSVCGVLCTRWAAAVAMRRTAGIRSSWSNTASLSSSATSRISLVRSPVDRAGAEEVAAL